MGFCSVSSKVDERSTMGHQQIHKQNSLPFVVTFIVKINSKRVTVMVLGISNSSRSEMNRFIGFLFFLKFF
jgi:hypothetical protein